MLNDFFANFNKKFNDHPAAQTNQFDPSKIEEYVSLKIENFVTQFNIPLVTVEETKKHIDKLSLSKATGPDGICVKVLKPLTRLFNISITKGIFPK